MAVRWYVRNEKVLMCGIYPAKFGPWNIHIYEELFRLLDRAPRLMTLQSICCMDMTVMAVLNSLT